MLGRCGPIALVPVEASTHADCILSGNRVREQNFSRDRWKRILAAIGIVIFAPGGRSCTNAAERSNRTTRVYELADQGDGARCPYCRAVHRARELLLEAAADLPAQSSGANALVEGSSRDSYPSRRKVAAARRLSKESTRLLRVQDCAMRCTVRKIRPTRGCRSRKVILGPKAV